MSASPTPAAVQKIRYTVWVHDWRPKAKTDGLNSRLSWQAARARKKRVKSIVAAHLILGDWPTELPNNGRGYTVTFTVRCARGPLPDSDNLAGMLKATRDAVAAFLNVSDGPDGIEWRYVAERGPDSTEITLESECV